LNWQNIKQIIQTIFNPSKKTRQILRNSKDQRPQLSSTGVYKISCSCGQVYIGEHGQAIDKRIRDVKRKYVMQSALSEHKKSKQGIKYCLTKRSQQPTLHHTFQENIEKL